MDNLINSIITLDNNEKFIVLNQALYQNKNYFLVSKIADNEEDLLDEFRLLEETETDDDKALKLVTDEKIINLLTKYFMPKE